MARRHRPVADAIREAADKAAERERDWWLVSLDEPTSTLFATTADHADVNLMATLYGDRHTFTTTDTDTEGVACVVTDAPVCVLAAPESFMRTLMQTIRANGLTGTYRKAGTQESYRF